MNLQKLGAAIGGSRGKIELVAPLRLTNTGDEAATVEFFDNYAAGTTLKRRSAGESWQPWDFSTITLQPGEYIEICGENQDRTTMLGKFEMTGEIAASGSIMSMVYGENTNVRNQLVLPFAAFGYYNEESGDEDGMFSGCTSLTTAPELPATTLAAYCYQSTFSGCTSLTTAPELPATTLAEGCYQSTFSGCTSLTTAPELPATTLAAYCYAYTFQGCTSLTTVSVSFISWDEENSATSNWLDDVAATGTFTCPAALDTTTRDGSHVPEGWTVENF